MKYSSWAAPEVVNMTTLSAAIDAKFIKIVWQHQVQKLPKSSKWRYFRFSGDSAPSLRQNNVAISTCLGSSNKQRIIMESYRHAPVLLTPSSVKAVTAPRSPTCAGSISPNENEIHFYLIILHDKRTTISRYFQESFFFLCYTLCTLAMHQHPPQKCTLMVYICESSLKNAERADDRFSRSALAPECGPRTACLHSTGWAINCADASK